jgi:DNA-binding NarL/FixJ family response regulator
VLCLRTPSASAIGVWATSAFPVFVAGDFPTYLPRHGVCTRSTCLRREREGKLGAIAANRGLVLIADEDSGSRDQLARVLETAGYDIVQVATGEEALQAVRKAKPSIVLLEIPLGGLSGYEVCRALREEAREIPIAFVSGSRTESYDRVAGLLVGADDYIVKPYAPDELLTRVRHLVRRAQPPAPSVTGRLTVREREILQLLGEGLRQEDIAQRLVISRKTVGTHVGNILRKLGVRSQTQAVAVAFRDELDDVVS